MAKTRLAGVDDAFTFFAGLTGSDAEEISGVWRRFVNDGIGFRHVGRADGMSGLWGGKGSPHLAISPGW
jgi:hypothetical protein